MIYPTRMIAMALVCLLPTFSSKALAQPTVREIPLLEPASPSFGCSVVNINDFSDVLLRCDGAEGRTYALWADGVTREVTRPEGFTGGECFGVTESRMVMCSGGGPSNPSATFQWSVAEGPEVLAVPSGLVLAAFNNRGDLLTWEQSTQDYYFISSGGGIVPLPPELTVNPWIQSLNDLTQVIVFTEEDVWGTWTPAGGFTAFAPQPPVTVRRLTDGEIVTNGLLTSLNNAGQIAGTRLTDVPWEAHAIRYTPGGGWTDLVKPVGFDSAGASAVNDRGQVVGSTAHPPDQVNLTQAVFWPAPDQPTLLGQYRGLPTAAHAINNVGVIVGYADNNEAPPTIILWNLTPSVTNTLRVTTPNRPSRWGLNTRQRISWAYGGEAAQFGIEITRDAGRTWEQLATVENRAGNSQNFYWQVEGPTGAAKFRVSAVGDETAVDVSDAFIRIARATIEMVTPRSNQSVSFGSLLRVHFKHSLGARAPIEIAVSGDNGNSWRVVAEAQTSGSTAASFRWNVDLPPTTRARVRVRALDGSGAVQMSRAFIVTAAGMGLPLTAAESETDPLGDEDDQD